MEQKRNGDLMEIEQKEELNRENKKRTKKEMNEANKNVS
jgi:hypothetical protein